MLKQLVEFSLLWSFVLFLSLVPALGSIHSNCTVGDSPDGDAITLTPTCFANTVKLEIAFMESDDHIRVRIDYICIGKDSQKITGTPWTRSYFQTPSGSRSSVSVTQLHPEMNCTFYACYRRFTGQLPFVYGKATPASCITDINECDNANGGCEHDCINTIGSSTCSCHKGHLLDVNGLNCSDIDECESPDLNNCHADAQCTNTKGSYTCTCNPGYTGDGINCTNIDECELGIHTCDSNANCTDTSGSFNCICIDGFEGNGFKCTDVDECETDWNNCHENAQCANTDGSFTCTCNPGYTGDGAKCTNIDECELGIHTCDCNANCTDTRGSFNCACIDGFEGDGFNCTALSSPTLPAVTSSALVLAMVVMIMIVVLMIIAVLVGVIGAVYQLKKLK